MSRAAYIPAPWPRVTKRELITVQPQADREHALLVRQNELLREVQRELNEIARELEITGIQFEAMMFRAGSGEERQAVSTLDAQVMRTRIRARDAWRMIEHLAPPL